MIVIAQAIPTDIKHNNVQRFADCHHSVIFAWNPEDDAAIENTWNFLIERVDAEYPPKVDLEKGETQSGDNESFIMEFGDIDPVWWIICNRFGIETWTLESIHEVLASEFYGQSEQLKHPATGEIGPLSQHIQTFLDKHPQGGTQGQQCDISELFMLEEI